MTAAMILRAGPLTTVQDRGRPGYAHLGVGRSGALDQPAHILANRLVGNPPDAATLETTLGGVALRMVDGGATIAVCGAVAPIRVNGVPNAWAAPVYLPPDAVLDVGQATRGLRCYIAVAGGFLADPVLGSRSTDLLSGLGPKPLRDGDRIPIASTSTSTSMSTQAAPPGADVHPVSAPPAERIELPVLFGPRPELFDNEAETLLTTREFSVNPQSNRIALRLDGPPLPRSGPDSIPSEGAVLGAIQVPADGKPIVFLADHPPTGGYPVIGVVPPAALHLAAQVAPGTLVRFRPTRLR